jgi:Domain of unknown function (DUF1840)
MIFTFHSKSSSNVLMMGPLAHEVLRALGREPLSQGIIAADDLASALRQLEAAVVAAAKPDGPEHTASENQPDEAVGLKQRAWPVQEMLRVAIEYGDVVTWSAQ